MKALERYNPVAVAVYYFTVVGIAMLCMHPILLTLSLFGAIFSCALYARRTRHALFWTVFLLTALLNPLLSHNGATVLLVLGDKPLTLESLVWGFVCGAGILAVLYWMTSLGALMTEDRLLYLFSKLSPKASLVLSMALRYIALFSEQATKIRQTQTALGLYKDDNVIDRVRGELRTFSVLLSWALENGIVTANSMAARAYGTGRRTHYSIFRFGVRDGILIALSLFLCAGAAIPLALGAVEFSFYPTIHLQNGGIWSLICYLSYGALVALPILIETEDMVKWKYLRSKI